jgi:RNA polymerase sigma-70 factor, ECF subfamily
VNDFRGTLASAKRGDEEAFARIWRAFQPGLLRYLRVKASTVAEDLAADTWLRVMRSLPTFEGDENCFRAWLYTTARNRVTDWYRGRDRRPEPSEIATIALLPAPNDVEAEAAEHSSTESALGLIDQLPPDQAEAVMLRVVVGLDPASVGRMMGRTPGSVRVLCHRGLRRLEGMLREAPSASEARGAKRVPAHVSAAPITPGRSWDDNQGQRRHG